MYKYSIKWNILFGEEVKVSAEDKSAAEAYHAVIYFAKQMGWKKPKWWQLWRWSDSRDPEVELL